MIPFPQNTIPRIWTLSNAVSEGTISEQELHELELLLETDLNVKEFYIDFININAEISWMVSAKRHTAMDLGPGISLDSLLGPPNPPPNLGFLGNYAEFFNQHLPLSFMFIFMIFGVALLAISYLSTIPKSGNLSEQAIFVAQITATKDCQWSPTITPPTEMMPLQASQQLQLEKGIVQITYTNGAVVLLEGPVSFTVGSPNSGFLSQGKLTARADTEKSRQFTIATPDARFVDMGTEFGVMIDNKGRAAVAVFAGKVNAEAKLADGRWTAPISLHKGEAVVCEGTKFTPQVAQRSNFPTLQQPPPPPPSLSFQHWLDVSQDLQSRQDLVAYYDFQPDPTNTAVLTNRASTGAALNGEILDAPWVDGRFPGKSALEFKKAKSGVKINLPQEMSSMTLAAWVNIESLPHKFNSLLMSDGWKKPFATHWSLRPDGAIRVGIQNEAGNLPGRGIGDGEGNLEPLKIQAWKPFSDQLGHWCILVTVYDSAAKNITCYFNGQAVETESMIKLPRVKFGPAMIGNWNQQTEVTQDIIRTLDGRIDELMIFQSALTAEEIKRIYETGKP
jgi:hypothetical protein